MDVIISTFNKISNYFIEYIPTSTIKQDIPFVKLLNKYGMKCTFNLNTGISSEAQRWVYKGIDVTIV